MLPIVETFHSLQGEGVHAGRSAFFIRLAGCNVGCPWCDTKPSWTKDCYPVIDVDALAEEAAAAKANFTVITGGEPLHHNLDALTDALAQTSHRPIHLETSGVEPLSGCLDWITLSPKRHHPPRSEVLMLCNELKVVVHEIEDLDFAEAMAKKISLGAILLLQPGWNSKTGQKLAIEHVKSHCYWRISIQSHKWLGMR